MGESDGMLVRNFSGAGIGLVGWGVIKCRFSGLAIGPQKAGEAASNKYNNYSNKVINIVTLELYLKYISQIR